MLALDFDSSCSIPRTTKASSLLLDVATAVFFRYIYRIWHNVVCGTICLNFLLVKSALLDSLHFIPELISSCSTSWMMSTNSATLEANMSISSRYTNTLMPIRGKKMRSISLWNVSGAWHNLNGIKFYTKSPLCVMKGLKSVFHFNYNSIKPYQQIEFCEVLGFNKRLSDLVNSR